MHALGLGRGSRGLVRSPRLPLAHLLFMAPLAQRNAAYIMSR